MKDSTIWKLSTLALAGALALTVGPGGSVKQAGAEVQPRMRAALNHLEAAQSQLVKASPDKGGHRVKALAATKVAIDQIQKGIEYDNTH
jgi:hypothetical protein